MRKYTQEIRAEAVALAKEVGTTNAAHQLGIPHNTLCGWKVADNATATEKRKPGRPPGSKSKVSAAVVAPKRRGRPPGSKSKPSVAIDSVVVPAIVNGGVESYTVTIRHDQSADYLQSALNSVQEEVYALQAKIEKLEVVKEGIRSAIKVLNEAQGFGAVPASATHTSG